MALKNLSIQSMISLSGAWLDPARDRNKLEKLSMVRMLLPLIDAVHKELLGLRQPGSGGDPEIRRKLEEADSRHDSKVRGTHLLLSGLAELAEDPDEASALLALRDLLVPLGLRTVQLSYRDEAGNADLVRASLSTPHRLALRKLKTLAGRTLEDEVNAYLDAGSQLARLEAERIASDRSGSIPADGLRARNSWIKAVRALQANLDLDPTADDTLRSQILGPLEEAEARANRRRGKSPDSPGGDDEPAPPSGPAAPAGS